MCTCDFGRGLSRGHTGASGGVVHITAAFVQGVAAWQSAGSCWACELRMVAGGSKLQLSSRRPSAGLHGVAR